MPRKKVRKTTRGNFNAEQMKSAVEDVFQRICLFEHRPKQTMWIEQPWQNILKIQKMQIQPTQQFLLKNPLSQPR